MPAVRMVQIHPKVRWRGARPLGLCREASRKAIVAYQRVLITQVVELRRQLDDLYSRTELAKHRYGVVHRPFRGGSDATLRGNRTVF